MKTMARMLGDLCQRFPLHFLGLLVLVVIQGGLNGISIIAVAPITDLLLGQSDVNPNKITTVFQSAAQFLGFDFNIVNVFIFFAAIMICNGFAAVFVNYATMRIKFDVLVHLLTGAMGKFFRARYQFFSQGKVGTLLNSFQYEVQKIGDSFGNFARSIANVL